MILRRLLSSTILLAAACGGGNAPPPAPPPAPTAPPPEKAEPAKPASDGKAVADLQRKFMEGCAATGVDSPEYCECTWTEFRKAFSDEEITTGITTERLAKVQPQLLAACVSKLPEATIQVGFEKGCTADKQELKPFCDCAWTEYRKQFSATELADERLATADRFRAARATVVKACEKKMPEKVAQTLFMETCAKDPAFEKFCSCGWKALRKIASPAELNVGLVDDEKLQSTVDKACAKLRPK